MQKRAGLSDAARLGSRCYSVRNGRVPGEIKNKNAPRGRFYSDDYFAIGSLTSIFSEESISLNSM